MTYLIIAMLASAIMAWLICSVVGLRVENASLNTQLAATAKHNGDLQTLVAKLEKDIKAINAERIRLQDAVEVAREGRDAAEATATANVQSEMAELRRQLANAGIKPAAVREAEHDFQGVVPLAFKEIQMNTAQAAQLERIREKQVWQRPVQLSDGSTKAVIESE